MSRRQELEAQTVAQLRKLAREAGLQGAGSLRKRELVDRLLQAEENAPGELPEAGSDDAHAAQQAQPIRRPFIGGLLQLVSALGLLLSVVAALVLPVVAVRAGRSAQGALDQGAATARELAVTVRTSRAGIDSASLALESAAQALRTTEQGLANSDPLLRSVGDLLGEELPTTIEATRAALLGARQGAAAMDRVLRGLRFLGLDYDPEQPLDESMEETATSLEPLPNSLRAVEGELDTSREDLTSVSQDLRAVSADLDELADQLGNMADSLQGYAADLDQAADSLEWAGQRAPQAGWLAAIVLAVLSAGFAASQYAAFTLGGLLRRGKLVNVEVAP